MTLMWEARAAEGRLAELVGYVSEHADPAATVYQAAQPQPRVVLLDPTGRGLPEVPAALLARPAHAWLFDEVRRG